MLGPLDAGVVVVVAEIPQVVRADPETATRAGWKLAALDATGELRTPATMSRPVHRPLAGVLHQPLALALRVHHRRRFRLFSRISVDHALTLDDAPGFTIA